MVRALEGLLLMPACPCGPGPRPEPSGVTPLRPQIRAGVSADRWIDSHGDGHAGPRAARTHGSGARTPRAPAPRRGRPEGAARELQPQPRGATCGPDGQAARPGASRERVRVGSESSLALSVSSPPGGPLRDTVLPHHPQSQQTALQSHLALPGTQPRF